MALPQKNPIAPANTIDFGRKTALLEKELHDHIEATNNPHGVTAGQIGLDKVDNTSDAEKPLSDLQKEYIDRNTVKELDIEPNKNNPNIFDFVLKNQYEEEIDRDTLNLTNIRAKYDVNNREISSSYATKLTIDSNNIVRLFSADGTVLSTAPIHTSASGLTITDIYITYDSSANKYYLVFDFSDGSSKKCDLSSLIALIDTKQDLLISGENIKTINNQSLLGSGDIHIETGGIYTEGTGINISEDNVISVDLNIIAEKSDIPTVNNSTVTFVQGSTILGSINLNQVTAATINIPEAINSVTWGDIQDKPTFATVATSGNYNDLSNTPTIPTKVSELENDSNYATTNYVDTVAATKQDIIADLATIRAGAALGATALQSVPAEYITDTELASALTPINTSIDNITVSVATLSDRVNTVESTISALSTVAFSGNYNDLSNKPTIPSKVSELDNDLSFATVGQIPTKVSELTNDSNYVTASSLAGELANYATLGAVAEVASTLSAVSSSVNNISIAVGSLTNNLTGLSTIVSNQGSSLTSVISQASVTAASLNGLESSLATISRTGSYNDLLNKPTIPTKTSELTNDSNFATVGQLPTVNNAVITFNQGTVTLGTISLNQSANATISIPEAVSSVTWGDITDKPTFATVATSGSYNDLSNTPTIGDGAISFVQSGSVIGSFNLNQTSNATIEIIASGTSYDAGDGIEITGSTISMKPEYVEYLEEQLYKYPAIDYFKLANNSTQLTSLEYGSAVTPNKVGHKESNIQNITPAQLTLYLNGATIGNITPSASTVSVNITPITIAPITANLIYKLEGTNSKGVTISKNTMIKCDNYAYYEVGSTITGTSLIQLNLIDDFKVNGAEIAYSEHDHLCIYTTYTCSNPVIEQNVLGTWVKVAPDANKGSSIIHTLTTITQANGYSRGYHAYELTNEFIGAGDVIYRVKEDS